MYLLCEYCWAVVGVEAAPTGWTYETDCDRCGRVIPSVPEEQTYPSLLAGTVEIGGRDEEEPEAVELAATCW